MPAVKSERDTGAGGKERARHLCQRQRASETPVPAVKSERDTGAGCSEPGAGESAETVPMGERDTGAGGKERARRYWAHKKEASNKTPLLS